MLPIELGPMQLQPDKNRGSQRREQLGSGHRIYAASEDVSQPVPDQNRFCDHRPVECISPQSYTKREGGDMPFVGHSWVILVLILLIVLIVIGPGKLGDLGGAVGRSMREFRKASHDDDSPSTGDPSKPVDQQR